MRLPTQVSSPARAAAALALAVFAVYCLAATRAASAAVYDVYFCHQANPPVDIINNSPRNVFLFVGCGTSSNDMQQSTNEDGSHEAGGTKAWRIRAPQDTGIASLSFMRSFRGLWFADDTIKWDLRTSGSFGGPGALDSFQTGSTLATIPRNPPDLVKTYTMDPLVPSVTSTFGCPNLGGTCAMTNNFDSFSVHIIDPVVGLDDSFPPAQPTLSGPLLAGGNQRGTRNLTYSASDRGSGVAGVTLTIDGALRQQIVDLGPTCHQPYEALVPCPLTSDGTLSVDTVTLSDGPHLAQVTVVDGAGLSSSTQASFTVSNTPVSTAPPTLTGAATLGGTLIASTGIWDGATGFHYTWLRCPADVTSGDGADRCAPILGAFDGPQYTVTDADVGRRIMVKVTASGPSSSQSAFSAPSGVIPARDTAAPVLQRVSLSPTRLRAGLSPTTLKLTSSEAAQLSIVIEQALPGTRVKRNGKTQCKPARHPARHARCTAYRRKAVLTQAINSGSASIVLSRIKQLKPGSYRVTITARDAAGNVSPRTRLTFRITR
jgi:hypothetical protein